MDPGVERYLRDLVVEARAVLRHDLRGAYAAGSVALDAYTPGRSDVDVALVTSGPLDRDTKRRLVRRLLHEALPCPARGLELVVYRREVAAAGSAEAAFEVEVNTGRSMEHRVTFRPEERPTEDGHFWYALDRDILHAHGLALVGPPAGDVFAALAAEDARSLLVTSLRWWHDRTSPDDAPTPGADDAVLSACRALLRHRDGTWLAKVEAAERLVRDGYGPGDLLRTAIDARSGGAQPSGTRARAFQVQVLGELGEAVP